MELHSPRPFGEPRGLNGSVGSRGQHDRVIGQRRCHIAVPLDARRSGLDDVEQRVLPTLRRQTDRGETDRLTEGVDDHLPSQGCSGELMAQADPEKTLPLRHHCRDQGLGR